MHPQRIIPFGAELRAGKLLTAVLLLASLQFLLALTVLAWLPALLLLAAWLAALAMVLRQSGLLGAPLRALRVDARGALAVQQRDGSWLPVHLMSGSAAFIWLVVLQLRDDAGQRQQLLVWRGAVPEDVHRALRVYVQWSRDATAASAASEQQ